MSIEYAAIAHQADLDCQEVLCGHVDGAIMVHTGDWVMVATGVDAAPVNFVTPVTYPATLDGFDDVHGRLLETGLAHVIVTRSGIDDHLLDTIRGKGYTEGDTGPVMVAVDIPPIEWPDELDRIEGMDAKAGHVQLLEEAFGLDRESIDRFVTDGLMQDDRVDIVVGLDEGIAVATAMGVTVNGVCGVFSVGTLTSHRGRGYGSALTAEVMRLARNRGASMTTLVSSPLGLSVYEGLGFDTVLTHIRWMPPT